MNIRRFASVCAVMLGTTAFSFPLHASAQVTVTDAAKPSEYVSFEIYLPLEHRPALKSLLEDLHTPGSASYHQWLTPAQFQAKFALSPDKVQRMQGELAAYGLKSQRVSAHQLAVVGTAAQVQAAFSTTLQHGLLHSGKRTFVASTPLQMPSSVAEGGGVVLAFSAAQRMHTQSRAVPAPQNRYGQAGGYWFDDLKQAYAWPSYNVVNGKGATVGLLMAGGFSQSDMNLYFGHEKLKTPNIAAINVNGGAPYDPNDGGTFEAELDIQQSAGMAPGANILLYSIPDLSDYSIVAGLIQALEDNTVDVLSMSFGAPEQAYIAEYNNGVDLTQIPRLEDDLFAEGNALGITFVASSGDYGADFLPPLACFTEPDPTAPCGTLLPAASFPASSPHVTGVGGTNLGTVSHPSNPSDLGSAYLYEEAFGDPLPSDGQYGTAATGAYWGSGGGDSIFFDKPNYQKLLATSSQVRAVPDIALHMGGCPGGLGAICNPEDSYDIEALGGHLVGVIGTSASAPDFAGLTALNVALQGTRMGNENYYIYKLAAAQKAGLVSDVFHTKVPGYNGLYTSGNNGYNRVLGVGTPLGKNFLLIPNAEAAGKPQTPSNP